MPYAVIVPGINTVFKSWNEVQRISILYPYARYRKFKTEEECWEYVKRYTTRRVYHDISKYGETFNRHYVTMEYFIRADKVYYNFFTKKLGYIAIVSEDANVEVINRTGNIKVILKNIYLDDNIISNHLIAIWHGLRIIGDLIDVDVRVPDHSIFYALMTYNGKTRSINRVRTYIDERLAKVSVSMKGFGNEDKEV